MHLADLRASGLTSETIEAAGLYTETDPQKISAFLGWPKPATRLGPCLIFGYCGLDGRPMDYRRIKPTKPLTKKGADGRSRTRKYEAPKGQPNRPYFPPGLRKAIADPGAMVLLTEGEKKSLKADQEGLPCIGLSGIWNWQQRRERDANGKPAGPRKLISELEEISWNDRPVGIAFDTDVTPKTKRSVDHARRELAKTLKEKGADVVLIDLPPGPNGSKQGLDDYLLTHTADDLLALVENAKELANISYETVAARVEAVLLGGGGEAFFADNSGLHETLAILKFRDEAGYLAIREKLRAAKVGVRAVDSILKPLIAAEWRKQPPADARDREAGYVEHEGKICRFKELPDGQRRMVAMCNFVATIVGEVTVDDGVDQQKFFEVEGRLADLHDSDGRTLRGKPLSRVLVTAKRFASMDWMGEMWGSDPVVYEGDLRGMGPAIQCLSDRANKKRLTKYIHTGWVQDGPNYQFLHAGGGISSGSSVSPMSVALEGPLHRFHIPPIKDRAQEKESLARVLLLLQKNDETDDSEEINRIDLFFALLAAVFRAPLGLIDFGLLLVGPTGVFKSESAALAQQFFGFEMDARHLPGSWSSTANSLETLAFLAKDVVLVVDDFAPTMANGHQLNQAADRIFRNLGNGAARGRAKCDGSLRPDKPPRALIVSTGEDLPRGHSLRARSLVVEVRPGMVSPEWLTGRQADARNGVYARCMRAYLEWLAPRYRQVLELRQSELPSIRDEFGQMGLHARTPAIAAELLFGWRCFTLFARDSGTISDEQRVELVDRCRSALLRIAAAQNEHHEQCEPADMFLKLLASVISSGRGHVAGVSGERPESCEAFGWRWRPHTSGAGGGEYQAQGKLVGWADEGAIYLDPDSSYAAIQQLAREQNDSIPITKGVLWKRLFEKGYLVGAYDQRNKVQKQIAGARRWVVALSHHALGLGSDDSGGDGSNGAPADQQDSDNSTNIFAGESY